MKRSRPKLDEIKVDPVQLLIDWQLRSLYTEEVYKNKSHKNEWKYQYHVDTHVSTNAVEDEFIAAYDRKYHKKSQKLGDIEDKLMDGYTHTEIASILGMTRRHVEYLIKVLRRIHTNGNRTR